MHQISLRTLAAALLSAGLLFNSAHAKDETTPLTVDGSFNAANAADKGFTIADNKALKGIKRVAVPVFAVEFIMADNVNAQTSGFGSAGKSSSSLYYKLLGVGEPEFQAITNALYTQFLTELRASGVEVIEASQVAAAPTYKKLVASGSPAPIKSDTTMTMSPPAWGSTALPRWAAATAAPSAASSAPSPAWAAALRRWAPSAIPSSLPASWTPA